MWQHQLQQCCPAWYATGVCPIDGHHNRSTWKQLAIAAADGQMLTFYIPVMTNVKAVSSKTQYIWNSGMPHSHHFAGCSMPCHSLQDLHVGYILAQTLKWRICCFAGAEKLQLEMYLCVVEDRCSSARLMMSTPSLHEYNISVLLELVYVLWVEQKQLQRGARFLAKVSC